MAFIGFGVILLCLVWATAVVACVLLMRYKASFVYLSIAVLAVASLFTIALWVKFRQDQQLRLELELKGDNVIIYDYSIVGRAMILTMSGTALLTGLLSVFKFHVTVPRGASRLPPWNSGI